MKIVAPPGLRSDFPPLASEPFWYSGENIRFRLGMPETIGLFAPLIRQQTGDQIRVNLQGGPAEMYADRTTLLIGNSDKLTVIDLKSGDVTEIDTPVAASTSGRWWFTGIEGYVICARAGRDNRIFAINRDTLGIEVLPNSPEGAVAGGVVGGILVLAGVQSFAGGGRKMVVRWSARRTDPSSSGTAGGPFGFEDWTPSDVNASGEVELDHGSEIIGGGSTEMGFVAWTDTRMYLFTPRPDLYVFDQRAVGHSGLLANHAWVEVDGRVWWWDQSLTLNVYDGGAPRQIPCTIRHSTIKKLNMDRLEWVYMAAIPEYGEIVLFYPGPSSEMRGIVYNYHDDAWYSWALNRIAMTDVYSPRYSGHLAIDPDGFLWTHDIREVIPENLTNPSPASWGPGSGIRLALPPWYALQPGPDPEAFPFFLMTNMVSPDNVALQSFRHRNVVLSYTYASSPQNAHPDDSFSISTQSYGKLDLTERPVVDRASLRMGEMMAPLRAGGKMVQFCITGHGLRTHIRFGALDVDADEGGKR